MHDAAVIPDVLGRLRRGEVTAVATVERQLELLRRAHVVTNGVAAFEDARALADAAALDRAFAVGGPVGPLHGLPVTVKDWIDVEGFPCAGETDDRDRRPAHDATVVRRLRAAGAVVVAKTRPWGGVAHPRDPARTVGGSSSGEAALVAAGASLLGLGSDSGGSIRLPAAWAGVCGLRPTFGRVPTTGHYPRVGPRSDGRTVIGPLAACVDDLELALTVIAGPDGRDMGAAPVPLRPSAGVFAAPTRPSGDLRAAARLGRPSHGAAGHLAAGSDADAGVAGAVGSGPGAAGGGGRGRGGRGRRGLGWRGLGWRGRCGLGWRGRGLGCGERGWRGGRWSGRGGRGRGRGGWAPRRGGPRRGAVAAGAAGRGGGGVGGGRPRRGRGATRALGVPVARARVGHHPALLGPAQAAEQA